MGTSVGETAAGEVVEAVTGNGVAAGALRGWMAGFSGAGVARVSRVGAGMRRQVSCAWAGSTINPDPIEKASSGNGLAGSRMAESAAVCRNYTACQGTLDANTLKMNREMLCLHGCSGQDAVVI